MRSLLVLLLMFSALSQRATAQLWSYSSSDFADNCAPDFDEQFAEAGPSLWCTTAQASVPTASASTVARFGFLEATAANSIAYECEEAGGGFAWSEFEDAVLVHDPAGGLSGTFQAELAIETMLDASGLNTQFGSESASYQIEIELGNYSEVFTDCTATRLPCGFQNPAPAMLTTPPIAYTCGIPLTLRVRVEVYAGGAYTVTETTGTSLAFARITWSGITGLSGDASATGFRAWTEPASTTQCTFGRLTVVDPQPSLRDGSILTSDVMRLAGDETYVSRAAVDGVTPIIVRFETDLPGVVDFTVEDETSSTDPARVGTLQRTVGTGGSNPLAIDMLPSGDRFHAFATLTVPADFQRDVSDDQLLYRVLEIGADFTPFDLGTHDTYSTSTRLELRRPPVVLVHGLWSGPSTWSYPLQGDPRFDVYPLNYESSHAAFFGDNISRLRARTAEVLESARSTCQAVTQVDWIGHSMGGVLGRIYASNRKRNYLRDDNYQAGDLHKLITLGTPHCGSPVAYLLVNADSTLTSLGWLFASVWPKCVDCGAVRDLRPDSVENQLLLETTVPAHALVGKGGSDLAQSGLESLLPTWMGILLDVGRLVGLAPQDIFPSELQHDGIVGRKSQQGGLGDSSPNVTVYGFEGLNRLGVHVTETFDTHFAGRAEELVEDSIPGAFAPGFAAAPIPECGTPLPGAGPAATLRIARGPGLTITAPVDGTPVSPGQTVTVTAVPTGGFIADGVLLALGAETEFFDAAPFSFDFVVPADALGTIVVQAFARNSVDEVTIATPVDLPVSLSATLLDVEVSPNPVQLYGFVGPERLLVRGVYSDAVERDLSDPALGTTFTVADPNIASVGVGGSLQPHRVGTTTVLVDAGGVSRTIDVFVVSAIGDFNSDGQFGVPDALELVACLDGPITPGQLPRASLPCRDAFDVDRNDAVDLHDFVVVAPQFRE